MRHKSKMAIFLVILIAIGATVNTGLVFALGNGATIGGGTNNSADGEFATVSGGTSNIARGTYATVGGGFGNRGSGSSIGGGDSNLAAGGGSTIAGGFRNKASGASSAVGGGSNNVTEGHGATIPGGGNNDAIGDYSFAAGRDANAQHAGTFVWADTSTPDQPDTGVNSTGPNQFLIRAAGGVGIGTNSPYEMLVVGDDLSRPFSGNRITVGNDSGLSGINLGEASNQRAFILWQDQHDYLELGTHSDGRTHGNTLVIKGDKVGVNLNSPTDSPPESLTVNGNVLADSFVRRSSQRWKTNIQTLEGALEKVQALRGVSYDWKDNGKHDIGLVAEEVGQVVPEAMVYAANGQDATLVDYALLVPVLIEAIKEQQAMIEELQAHIDQGLY
jgi:Chaperone of endosialidase